MTAPEDLNRRLTLLEPINTAADDGGVVRAYQTRTKLWAQVVPQLAAAAASAASLGAALCYRIILRCRNDVTTRHQFRDGAHLYRVIAARARAPTAASS